MKELLKIAGGIAAGIIGTVLTTKVLKKHGGKKSKKEDASKSE